MKKLFYLYQNCRIGSSNRDQYYKRNENPGPGMYEFTSFKRETPMYSFGANERIPNYLSKTTTNLMNVGPGTYELKSTLRLDKGNTMSSKRQDNSAQLQSTLPGPGAYDPSMNYTKKKLPEYKQIAQCSLFQQVALKDRKAQKIMYLQERKKFQTHFNSTINQIQKGPGKYEPITKIVYQTSPNFRIGSGKRQDMNLKTPSPGPAAYSLTSMAFEGSPKIYQFNFGNKQFSIMPKREDKTYMNDRSQTPGPDRYDVNVNLSKERSFAFKIGKSHRDFVHIEKNPGPGTYQNLFLPQNHGTSYSFGKDSRMKPTYKDELPGPGQYQLKTFVEDFPNFVLPKEDKQ